MIGASASDDGWSVASFPSPAMLNRFVHQVTFWNDIDDLAEVRVRRLPDGASAQLHCAGAGYRGLCLLVESLGGRLISVPVKRSPAAAVEPATCDWP